jgi:hypothetical protein
MTITEKSILRKLKDISESCSYLENYIGMPQLAREREKLVEIESFLEGLIYEVEA